MSLDITVQALRRELTRLLEAMEALHTTIAQDAPVADGPEPVERLDMLVTEMVAMLEEAMAVAAGTAWLDDADGTLEPERRGLRAMHDLLNAVTERYTTRLASHDVVSQLFHIGYEHGQGWWQWSEAVKTGIDVCATPLIGAASAMSACWSELAERLARHSVSVRATNIGQQITVPDGARELAGRVT